MAPKSALAGGAFALLCAAAPSPTLAQHPDAGELAVYTQIKRLAQLASIDQLQGLQQRRDEWRSGPVGRNNSRLQLQHGGLDLDWQGEIPSRSESTLTGFSVSRDFFAGPTCHGSQQAGISAGSSFASGDSFARRLDGEIGYVGNNDLQSHFVGAYFSDFRNTGRYLDLQAKVAYLQVDNSTYRGARSDAYGIQLALSAEGGYALALTEYYGVEPQLQLVANYTNFTYFQTERFGLDLDVTPELALRAGLRAYRSDGPHFVFANLWEVLDGDDELSNSHRHQRGARWLELGLGSRLLELPYADISFDLRYRTSADDHDWQGLSAGVGFSWAW
ncbi:autotransporter outer membrane beta-barrel domain-containing protein [Microbulbifer yueqingensis]|uniref:Outer membrane autotransporter barrel domain-containing protein n=1 Tax=Microbulbifer yueqingensis TaxID=658219 RepID=A0A1G9CJ26_9GAMM|nr:autotransporter outer membrane beta-barrel domain-containing protein [Microbulbifer yueqingensis]SDK51586.1 outer membrane autotransporter barrel domain-containing protein [Microbulbifer yueqingensis]